MKTLFVITAIFLGVFLGNSAIAAETDETNPHKTILNTSNQVLAVMRDYRKKNVTDTVILGSTLLKLIDPIMDFKAIAKAVMGKHYKLATPEQKAGFVPILKKTMSQLYAKSLVKFEIDSVSINEKDGFLSDSKGKVATKVVASDGVVYSIVYTIRKNSNNKWRVRNIILDGINLGLTYRNQFYSSANQHEGDIGRVISGWSADMDV